MTPDRACGETVKRLGKTLVCEQDADHLGAHLSGDINWDKDEPPMRYAARWDRGPGTTKEAHAQISAAQMLEAADRFEHYLERLERLARKDRL